MRIAGHQSQQQRARRHPAGQAAEFGDLPYGFRSLLKFEMAQVLLNDRGHRHAQRGGEIVHRHGLLLLRVCKQAYEQAGEILRVTGFVKIHGQVFALAHLAKVRQVGTQDGNAVGASKVSHSAAAG
jgi:hypothetical protein